MLGRIGLKFGFIVVRGIAGPLCDDQLEIGSGRRNRLYSLKETGTKSRITTSLAASRLSAEAWDTEGHRHFLIADSINFLDHHDIKINGDIFTRIEHAVWLL